MEQTRAEAQMQYLIDSCDGRIGTPAVSVGLLMRWIDEIKELRRQAQANEELLAELNVDPDLA